MNTTVGSLHRLLKARNLLSDKDIKGKSITFHIALVQPIVWILGYVILRSNLINNSRMTMSLKALHWRSVPCDGPKGSQQLIGLISQLSLHITDMSTPEKTSSIASPPAKRYHSMFRPQNMSALCELLYDNYQFKQTTFKVYEDGDTVRVPAESIETILIGGLYSLPRILHHSDAECHGVRWSPS